jgi:ribose transport system substrate-binding protein
MKSTSQLRPGIGLLAGIAATLMLSTAAMAAGPEIVSGPGAEPECFKPQSADTKYFQWPAKPGPYRIALANGFIANDWRVQMIKTAKAYAEQPSVKPDIKEFKAISVGLDVAAQIASVNNFIDQGYDAVIVNAVNPSAFGAVVKKAWDAGVVLLSFDNIIEDANQIIVNVDQPSLGTAAGEHLVKQIEKDGGKLLEVRGPAGNTVDRDRHDGFHKALDASGKKWEVTEVVGNWAPGDAQKVAADAMLVSGPFDGIYVQGGSQGAAQALLDSGQPLVPISGETENVFGKICDKYGDKGLRCSFGGTGPGQVAVTIKTAIAALKGEKVPQNIALPTSMAYWPDIKPGRDFFPDLPDSFFVGNNFEACNIGFTAEEIGAQTGDNN